MHTYQALRLRDNEVNLSVDDGWRDAVMIPLLELLDVFSAS
jgi:hypothetical protein